MKTTFALSTVTCTAGCPASPTADDIVTRSDEPVPSCTDGAKLTAVYASGATGVMPPSGQTPSVVSPPQGEATPSSGGDVPAGAGRVSVGGAIALGLRVMGIVGWSTETANLLCLFLSGHVACSGAAEGIVT
ncbi:hypothetical protein LIA77_09803 [Sarocladium implicatum]|nr:hypothetical protein LIA77_09803 [Sarocladium implicatum]